MRAIVTRVTEASVTIDGAEYSRIGRGFLVLLGVHVSDTAAEADRIVDRICGLRVFEDEMCIRDSLWAAHAAGGL